MGALTWTASLKSNASGLSRKPSYMANTNFEMRPQALLSPALASHDHRATVERSNFVIFVVQTLATAYHSWKLRLCRLRRRNCLPLSQREAAQCIKTLSCPPNPQTHHQLNKISEVNLSSGAKNIHEKHPAGSHTDPIFLDKSN